MSWRRFMVLVRGLSPQSATVTSISAQKYISGGPNREVQTDQQAEDALAAMFRRPSVKVVH